jgi:hypothetical protein
MGSMRFCSAEEEVSGHAQGYSVHNLFAIVWVFFCSLPAFAGSSVCSGEAGQNLPKPITDNATATSVAFIGETGQVVSIVVSVNLSHTYAGDVDMLLRSPDGTIIELTTDNGGDSDFDGTIGFDDTAANSIVGASGSLSGTFRPEQPLSTFAGERMSAVAAAGGRRWQRGHGHADRLEHQLLLHPRRGRGGT